MDGNGAKGGLGGPWISPGSQVDETITGMIIACGNHLTCAGSRHSRSLERLTLDIEQDSRLWAEHSLEQAPALDPAKWSKL